MPRNWEHLRGGSIICILCGKGGMGQKLIRRLRPGGLLKEIAGLFQKGYNPHLAREVG